MLVFKARPRRDPAQREDITESQKRIMRLLGVAMREVRDQIENNEGLLMDALQHSTADKVAALVTVEPWLAMQEALQDELQEELIAAGNRVKLPRIQKALATFRFDAPNKDASNFAVKQGASLVTEVISQQRDTIKSLVSDAQLGRGLPPKAMARQLKNTVGLTTQQAGWVRNFEDRAVNQAMAAGKTFDQALEGSQKATQRYHDKIHRYRTETIARTETLKASNEGRNAAWKQGVDEGFISPTAVREWQAEGSACDICMPLNGVQVPLSETFPQGDPPRHPNCRCNVKLVDEIPEDILGMTSEQLDTEIASLLGSEATVTIPSTAGPRPVPNKWPEEQIAQFRAQEKIKRDEFARLAEEEGVPRFGVPDPDLHPRSAKAYREEREIELQRFAVQNKFLDDTFSAQNGVSAGDASGRRAFSEKGYKWRDKYVVEDEATLKLNAALRAGKGKTARTKNVDEMIAEHTVKQDTAVYRGIIVPKEVADEFKPGTTFTDKGFQSSDIEASGARGYAQIRANDGIPGEKVLFEITIGPETKAAYVYQGEVVIGRDAIMEIVSTRVEDGWKVVEVIAKHADKQPKVTTPIRSVSEIVDEMPKIKKISVDEFDEKIADMARDQFEYFGPGRKEGHVMQKATGYDAKPVVATEAEVDELVSQGWKQVYRGIEEKSNSPSPEKMFETFKTGDMFPGRGSFGSGTYSAVQKERAVSYGGGKGSVDAGRGVVWRMALSPDAKILKHSDVELHFMNKTGPYKPKPLNEKYRTDTEGAEFDFYYSHVEYDEGYAAMREGYDAIEVYNFDQAETYYVILNRGKVVVQDVKETGDSYDRP